MKDAAMTAPPYTHYSVASSMTMNKCLSPTESLPETPAKEGKIRVGGCDH